MQCPKCSKEGYVSHKDGLYLRVIHKKKVGKVWKHYKNCYYGHPINAHDRLYRIWKKTKDIRKKNRLAIKIQSVGQRLDRLLTPKGWQATEELVRLIWEMKTLARMYS